MNFNPEPRRERIYMVDQSDELRLFTVPWHECQCVRVPVHFSIPDDAKVLGVHYDYAVNGFAFIVSHESFDLVPPGHCAPIHSMGIASFRVKKIDVEAKPFDVIGESFFNPSRNS